MAALHPNSPLQFFSLAFFLLAALGTIPTSHALEFHVGGERGWMKPTGNETETYNQWAQRNRFHICDSIYFKYKNDSVLLVEDTDYATCSTTNPVLRFQDGNTTFTFHRYGFFYFISGKKEHCLAGQKMIIRVMVHPREGSPVAAPGPGPNGDQDYDSASLGPQSFTPNSGLKIKTEALTTLHVLGVFGVTLFV